MGTQIMVLPGDIIKEYLDEYGITQKNLAARTGISEKHISNVLSGRARLTEDFALKLEKVMPDVSASYWLNYECKYRENLARQKETYNLDNVDLQNIAKRFRFKDVFSGLKLTIDEQAIEMLKLLGISDFDNFNNAYQNLSAEFMEDGGDKEAIAVWLSLCDDEIDVQNEDLSDVEFSISNLKSNLQLFKSIANNGDLETSLKSCRKLFNSLGVFFVVCGAIPGCKVRGALKTYRGRPAILVSERFKRNDYVWFSIIHEIGHLVLHYRKNDLFISYDDIEDRRTKEIEANKFARDFFIDPIMYNTFIRKEDFSKQAIRKFAAEQNVHPNVVLGRLQHDQVTDFAKKGFI